MGSHPINLGLRFILELAALIISGMWGWKLADSWLSLILAVMIPIAMATIWGVFAVPKDPSRSGNAPVPVTGWLRLLIELAFFAFATFCLLQMDYKLVGWGFSSVVVIHYVISYDRIIWLLRQ
jgi:hypothetical protein